MTLTYGELLIRLLEAGRSALIHQKMETPEQKARLVLASVNYSYCAIGPEDESFRSIQIEFKPI